MSNSGGPIAALIAVAALVVFAIIWFSYIGPALHIATEIFATTSSTESTQTYFGPQPDWTLIVAVGALIGLVAVGVIVLLWWLLDRRNNSRDPYAV